MINNAHSDRKFERYIGTLESGQLGYLEELGIELGEENHLSEYQDAEVSFEYTADRQKSGEEVTDENLKIRDLERNDPISVYETDFEDIEIEWEKLEGKLKDWNFDRS